MGALTAWLAAAGLQVYRDIHNEHRPPMPGEFVGSAVLFGSLAVLSTVNSQLAGTLAWGFLLSVALQAGGPQQLMANGSTWGPAHYVFPPSTPPAGQQQVQQGQGQGHGGAGGIPGGGH